ncbi:helix-turn-helix domain-containing protein [Paenibacillus sp. TAB 01]|uniref:helix-turn-helix domain-containing protein n=1 Tax=Paenibacillus sp. TAB 01 TaxID=3368988 RepID=UPI0037524FC2
MKRDELVKLIQSEVLTVAETLEILDINKQNLSALIKSKKLLPVKEVGSTRLFLRTDVEERRKQALILREKFGPREE